MKNYSFEKIILFVFLVLAFLSFGFAVSAQTVDKPNKKTNITKTTPVASVLVSADSLIISFDPIKFEKPVYYEKDGKSYKIIGKKIILITPRVGITVKNIVEIQHLMLSDGSMIPVRSTEISEQTRMRADSIARNHQ